MAVGLNPDIGGKSGYYATSDDAMRPQVDGQISSPLSLRVSKPENGIVTRTIAHIRPTDKAARDNRGRPPVPDCDYPARSFGSYAVRRSQAQSQALALTGRRGRGGGAKGLHSRGLLNGRSISPASRGSGFLATNCVRSRAGTGYDGLVGAGRAALARDYSCVANRRSAPGRLALRAAVGEMKREDGK